MEHKPIYLDGVDVKNCKGIDLSLSPLVKCKSLKFKTSDGGIAGIWCSDHTNCYFKQLARKTQECEELKKQLMQKSEVDMFFNTPIEGWSNDPCGICPHKAENEELKKQVETSEKWRIKAESLNEKLDIKNTRYRKALEEIEEYCENQISITGDLPFRTTASDILDIINKAKGENNG